MAHCIFCGPTADKITREDIWPKWISKHHQRHGVGAQGYKARRRRLDEGLREFDTKEIDLKVRVVCKKCNNNWLSSLEDDVKPLAIPLMLGEESDLMPESQTT